MKKGQIQINETLMVVFIIVVIILLGLVVFFKFNSADIDRAHKDHRDFRIKAMIATFPDLGEIKCSKHGTYEDCVDMYKVLVMNALFKSNEQYRTNLLERYGFMDIRFQMIYPDKGSEECHTGKTKDCGTYVAYSNVPRNNKGLMRITTPISVYVPNEDRYGIALLNISRYFTEYD